MRGFKIAHPGHFGGEGWELTPPTKKSRPPRTSPIANRTMRFRVPSCDFGMRVRRDFGGSSTLSTTPIAAADLTLA
jgi:hypothetical protein